MLNRELAVTVDDVREAAEALRDVAEVTPIIKFRPLSEQIGRPVYLKLENLQRAGSFKIRGAYNRMAHLTDDEKRHGVVAASAGNHAQGVALAAQQLGIDAVIYMPVDAPLPKLAATRAYGAQVKLVGRTVDEALTFAKQHALETGSTLIHPFDHADIVAGQGTIGLEILEQVPDVASIIVPVGGGGLIAGIAAVTAELAPSVKVIGVQAKNAAAYPDSLLAQRPIPHKPGRTMADGIAVGTPGEVPLGILSHLGTTVRTVSESDLARALLLLAERAKLVVEPSGGAGIAALLNGADDLPDGPVVVVISGGNIDPLLLMRIIRRGMVEGGRLQQWRIRVDDRPGGLAKLVSTVADAGANIVDVRHSRTDARLGIFDAMVFLELEVKGPAHAADIEDAIAAAGFQIV
jgi:threonine dehydratase